MERKSKKSEGLYYETAVEKRMTNNSIIQSKIKTIMNIIQINNEKKRKSEGLTLL